MSDEERAFLDVIAAASGGAGSGRGNPGGYGAVVALLGPAWLRLRGCRVQDEHGCWWPKSGQPEVEVERCSRLPPLDHGKLHGRR